MRVLFVENQDSFSWNVVETLPFTRETVEVVDGRQTPRVLARLRGTDALVVGPGPKDPVRAGLLDVIHEAAALGIPTLGICLGHQALGMAFGARLIRVTPAHGKQSQVRFTASRLFPGITGTHWVMRYHSLALVEVPAPLHVVATTEDGLIMAMEHAALPMASVQFHPDSHGTPGGTRLVHAFFHGLQLGRP